MTKQELNRDVKRLWRQFQEWKDAANYGVFKTEEDITKEWKRLWYADQEANYMKLEQLKAMIRINNSMRIIQLHRIGLLFEPNL